MSLVAGSRSHADAWHTTFLSWGLTNNDRSQKVSGNGSNPKDKKKSSAISTISISVNSLSKIIEVKSIDSVFGSSSNTIS